MHCHTHRCPAYSHLELRKSDERYDCAHADSLACRLANYRLFYALTTLWCPEREEHGYFYAPVFKCSTNPRVATAHRWTAVDVVARMNKPTGTTLSLRSATPITLLSECFYSKDGTWYYAGIYKAFLMDTLNVKEWAELPTEVRSFTAFPSLKYPIDSSMFRRPLRQ